MIGRLTKTFKYSDERLGLNASPELISRVSKYFDEETFEGPDCLVEVHEVKPFRRIVKDKSFPYSRHQKVGCNEFEYYRYDTHVRTTVKVRDNYYKVFSYTKGDERGVLNCYEDYYFNNHQDNAVIHGTLIFSEGEGILFTAPPRSGKTTLAMSFMKRKDFGLISEGVTLLKENNNYLEGSYIPHPIYVRIYPLISFGLYDLMDNVEETCATQPLDDDAFERVRKAKKQDLDADITVAREVFTHYLGVERRSESPITRVVFPSYAEEKEALSVYPMGKEEGLKVLEEQLWPYNLLSGEVVNEQYFHATAKHYLKQCVFKGIKFNSKEQLSEGVLEELLG